MVKFCVRGLRSVSFSYFHSTTGDEFFTVRVQEFVQHFERSPLCVVSLEIAFSGPLQVTDSLPWLLPHRVTGDRLGSDECQFCHEIKGLNRRSEERRVG